MATRIGYRGHPPTLEQWHATPPEAPRAPQGGSQLTERYEAPMQSLEDLVADLRAPWRRWAACKGMPIAVFYPERGQTPGPALEVCARCPVRDECAATAARHDDTDGVWGGTSGRQRRRQRRAAA